MNMEATTRNYEMNNILPLRKHVKKIFIAIQYLSGVGVAAHRDCWKISYTPAYYGMPYKNPHVIIACRSLAEAQNQISAKPHF